MASGVVSAEGTRLVADLLAVPPATRHEFMAGMDRGDWLAIVQASRRDLGSMYGIFQDDPVGFIQFACGERLWSKQREIALAVEREQIVAVPACHGPGKALALDTLLPTPSGWTTMGEVQPGDLLLDEQGKPCLVTYASPVEVRRCWRVSFDDGTSIVASDEHLWSVLDARTRGTLREKERNAGRRISDWREHWALAKTVTSDALADMRTSWGQRRWSIPTTRPLAGARVDLPIGPYTLGAWLGDGATADGVITIGDSDAEEMLALLRADGAVPTERRRQGNRARSWGLRGAKVALRSLGVLGRKHIPAAVLRADEATRLAVLQGLMDTDGYPTDGAGVAITVRSRDLADGIVELARTFGWKVRRAAGPAKLYGRTVGTRYVISFRPDRQVFRLRRKQRPNRGPQQSRGTAYMITAVTPAPEQPVRCVTVDSPSSLYLAGESMVPTHNTHFAARLVAWWLCVWPTGTAVAVTTAPRFRQVKTLLWPHVGRLHARHQLPGTVDQTQWKMRDENGREEIVAYGFSAPDHDEDAAAGIHAPHVLLVVDEGGGISPTIGNAFRSGLTGGHTRLFVIGNPPVDGLGGWFEGLCEAPDVVTIPIPAGETPNFTGEDAGECRSCARGAPPHPIATHLVDQRWVEAAIRDHGPDSPWVLAKVHARFPKGSVAKAIPWSWIEAACDNDTPDLSTWVRLGVDVAADGGDELAVARWDGNQGRVVRHESGEANASAVDVAGRILLDILDAQTVAKRLGSRRKVRVKIDTIGIGWGVASTLRAWGSEGRHDAEIVDVDVREKANDTERYANRRAEMWWTGRLAVQPRGDDGRRPPQVALDVDEHTRAQLHGPKYGADSQGRIKIESKDDMKRRGVPSPDRGESLLLGLYEPEPVSPARTHSAVKRALPPTRPPR